MSKSNLEKSQADTDHSSAAEETLDSFPSSPPPGRESRHAAVLSVLYAVAMTVISGLLLRRHSHHWKRWAAAVGALFYALGRAAIRTGSEK